ncbi:hypothetical protein HPG69_017626, partial [Diceros bicornis minor]
SSAPAGLPSAVPEGDKNVITRKILGTVKWSNDDLVVYQTAVKNNLRKYLCGAEDGETVEFDVEKRKECRGSKWYRPWWNSSLSW